MNDNPQPLWTPSPQRIAASRMHDYMRWLGREKNVHVDRYDALWQWSVDNLPAFWESIWQYFDIQSGTPYARALDAEKMPGAARGTHYTLRQPGSWLRIAALCTG